MAIARAIQAGLLKILLLGLLGGSVAAQQLQAAGDADDATQINASVQPFAVAAPDPLAIAAGRHILQAGGSAVDAAIAVQMVLAVVQPQSGGLGGGAFMLHYDGYKIEALDGGESSPDEADENLFIGVDGRPLPFYQAAIGGRAVGVPGLLRMLELAHQQHGKLPWARLFSPAIALAQNGFAISPRLHTLLSKDPYLRLDPAAASYFYQADGQALPAGSRLTNPALASILEKIATQGPSALLQGSVAQAMVDKVRNHPSNPGHLSLDDLAQYQAQKRQPLCIDYTVKPPNDDEAKTYVICGMPPPSSSALTIAQILGILAYTPAAGLALENNLPSAQWLHLYTEAARLAWADQVQYVADPDLMNTSDTDWRRLLQPNYLHQRAQLIGPGTNAPAMFRVQSGNPSGLTSRIGVPSDVSMNESLEDGTSHISIVDAWGNALAMSSSIKGTFGARQLTDGNTGLPGGFLLNNQLTDFSFTPTDPQGRPIANRVQGGKRPRSSMSPTLVFEKSATALSSLPGSVRSLGPLVLCTGSAGGPMTTAYTFKALYAMLHWNMDARQALQLANFGLFGDVLLLEEERFTSSILNNLQARRHNVYEVELTSSTHSLQNTGQGWQEANDPRFQADETDEPEQGQGQ